VRQMEDILQRRIHLAIISLGMLSELFPCLDHKQNSIKFGIYISTGKYNLYLYFWRLWNGFVIIIL